MSKCYFRHRPAVIDAEVGVSYIAVCLNCDLMGPVRYNPVAALSSFEQLTNKENTMSVTSEYRRGVEDATKPFKFEGLGTTSYDTTRLNIRLSERRKILLTKKVTKWVNIYRNSEGSIRTGFHSVYDSKGLAKENSTYPDYGFTYVDSYPIEIEVPID